MADPKYAQAAQDAGTTLVNSNVTYLTKEEERKNEVGIAFSTLGVGIIGKKGFDKEDRFKGEVGAYTGGAFKGPMLAVETSYDVLKGNLVKTTALGDVDGYLNVGAMGAIGPDQALLGAKVGGGLKFNKKFDVGLEVGPAAVVNFDDHLNNSQPYTAVISKLYFGYKW